MTFRIGIISDTHGLLRPEAERRLIGVDQIIHGGGIWRPRTTSALRRMWPAAPVQEKGGNRGRTNADRSAKATRAVPRRGLSRRRKRGSERLSGARAGARCRYAARLLGALRDRRLLPDLADCFRGGPADAILQRVRAQGNDGVDGSASRRW